jgi:rhodanese-related sulfurtransferase
MNPITHTELKELLEGGQPPILIDVAPEQYYRAAHIPDAKNCCVYDVTFIDQAATAVPDKAVLIVVYGSSSHSLASSTAQQKLNNAGYTHVRDYRGGLEDWCCAGLPIERGPEPPAQEQPREGHHEIDIAKSLVYWTGRNINGAHCGTIRLKSGWLDLANAATAPAATGECTLDMDSLANTDLNDTALNQILIAHLKSDDFFDTALFPIATFHLRHVTLNPQARPGNINADIDGALTLKGVTEGLAFPALVEVLAGGALTAEAHFDIDRTRWNVIYGSGKFYENLGKHLVHDILSLSLHIVTR